MNIKQALLTLPLLALTFAPTVSAKHHSEKEWHRRAENSARARNRYNTNHYRNRAWNGSGSYNSYSNSQLRLLDRNRDGVITPKEREHYYRQYGRQYPNGWRY
jgi:hypothetical protein